MGAEYGHDFYDVIRAGVKASAAAVVPIVYDMVRPRTVIDVGCGEGWWALEFAHVAEVEVIGIDSGDVPNSPLGDRFIRHDLTRRLPDATADLVVCLEVAEHLPERRAESFVAELCAMAPVVMFSAAIPGQGGTGHLNERWPDYWADMFEANGYAVTGALRSLIWDDPTIENWYRQNLLIAAADDGTPRTAALADLFRGRDVAPRSLVHPVLYDARRRS